MHFAEQQPPNQDIKPRTTSAQPVLQQQKPKLLISAKPPRSVTDLEADMTCWVELPAVSNDPIWDQSLQDLDQLHDKRRRLRKALEKTDQDIDSQVR